MIGTLLGNRYELLEKVGEGGMAIVYKAKCHLLNRFVAVKILKEEFSNNIEFMEKFRKEALSVASLSSNNIVNIYDVGSERDINYIVMEYIKGKTLKEIIVENGSMNTELVLDYGMQIAKALECAHKNNIIHRDIKPHNILVTEDGTVKVTDFGIAKAASSVTITNTSTVMGSAHYFSPEQAKASFVDCRTDIYSFGIVLYEMVTGRVPYDAESPVSVALKHIREKVVPPKEINNKVPENLNKLILKAIEKEPIKRYQTAKEMYLDLQRIHNNSEYTIASNSMDNEYTRVMAPVNMADYEKEEDVAESPEPMVKNENKNNNENKNKNKKKTIITALIILLVVICSAVGFVYIKSIANNAAVEAKIVVPKIIGLDKAAAEKLVVAKKLTFAVDKEVNSDEPKGAVTACFPDEGTEVKENSQVRVYVSKGPEGFKMISVKGMDRPSAKASIEEKGLELSNVREEPSDTVASGIVISQNPNEGSLVQKADKVDLVISTGPKVKVTQVPSILGKTLDQASTLLQNSNLTLGDKKQIPTNDKSQDGKISSQSIDPNTSVTQGSSVWVGIYTYKAPEKQQVDVPDFKGKTVKDARNMASQNNVNIAVSGNDEDIIQTQDKDAGTKVSAGDTINLTSKAMTQDPTKTDPTTNKNPKTGQ
ncbi:Stk1 family PASTA domain-containing Ser/Thr kinase [Clostridium estertheticum]|uniref:non-specific serine/threonine protein kinase n=1 Tax=Clostridium estertheticum subsp. estertheticum TaxID=1552 RepID=A0A1J0GHY7_9CLOT|nr:Stk1 family PASTA domain-containing Ser/Thr kinase [Clostridium estertheticum]APC40969.1 protein kinase [Clostridium estertheticum subsp. estertheticum]MBZ9617162.1 Stk1 family PASTA domain-containing Ser/Thr kinase [Clostridium estertheticum subsp. laramiense]WAG72854.1 Stk1 family PASTA domain-containing Ser/Thr kinase [Clostridium estertheticum]